MNIKKLVLSACVAGTLTVPMAAMAQVTQSMQVEITIAGTCSGLTTNTLDFGTYPDLSADRDGSTTFDVKCTNGLGYQVGIDNGADFDTGSSARRMKNGSNYIHYGLYKDAARTQSWSYAQNSADIMSATGSGIVQTHTIYGRAPSTALGQPTTIPVVGTYVDTVTVAVYY